MRQWKNRNEIDNCLWCVNSRTYTRNEKGEWEQFTIFEDREDPALQEQARMAKVTARLQLENNVYDYLKFSFDFKSDEINKNKKTLIEGQNRIPDFMGFLGELKKGARLAESPKGYVIGAIKRKLKEI